MPGTGTKIQECSGIVQFQGVTNIELGKEDHNSTASPQETL